MLYGRWLVLLLTLARWLAEKLKSVEDMVNQRSVVDFFQLLNELKNWIYIHNRVIDSMDISSFTHVHLNETIFVGNLETIFHIFVGNLGNKFKAEINSLYEDYFRCVDNTSMVCDSFQQMEKLKDFPNSMHKNIHLPLEREHNVN